MIHFRAPSNPGKLGNQGKVSEKIGQWVLDSVSGNILLAHWGFQYLSDQVGSPLAKMAQKICIS